MGVPGVEAQESFGFSCISWSPVVERETPRGAFNQRVMGSNPIAGSPIPPLKIPKGSAKNLVGNESAAQEGRVAPSPSKRKISSVVHALPDQTSSDDRWSFGSLDVNPLPSTPIPGLEQPAYITCFKSGEQTAGLNKICYYNWMGGGVAVTIKAVEICPLSIQQQCPDRSLPGNGPAPKGGGCRPGA